MIDYYEYIKSEQWRKKSAEVHQRNEKFCECCLMRYGYAVHHRTYERLGNELDEDLILLCNTCHKLVHEIIPLRRRYVWPSRLAFLQLLIKEAKSLKEKKR